MKQEKEKKEEKMNLNNNYNNKCNVYDNNNIYNLSFFCGGIIFGYFGITV